MTDAETLTQVREAFASAERPVRFTDRDHCCECAEHDDLLRSRDLDSLTVEDVGNPGWDPLCFATDEAFLYYFPALARLALDDPDEDHGWYLEQLLFHLTYEGTSNRRLLAATPRQRDAVVLLLRHVQATRRTLVIEYLCEKELLQAIAAWGTVTGESFESVLTGGHPNSLGRTVEVVDAVLAAPERFADLFGCYASDDPVVRLRTSNAMKRIAAQRPELLVPYIDRFIAQVGAIDQASARWTLAQLFAALARFMTPEQRVAAQILMQRNLSECTDWIVLSTTMETLTEWAADDSGLAEWLRPRLDSLSHDDRRSVAKRARKLLATLEQPGGEAAP